jgi:hypothetical protein
MQSVMSASIGTPNTPQRDDCTVEQYCFEFNEEIDCEAFPEVTSFSFQSEEHAQTVDLINSAATYSIIDSYFTKAKAHFGFTLESN